MIWLEPRTGSALATQSWWCAFAAAAATATGNLWGLPVELAFSCLRQVAEFDGLWLFMVDITN